MNQFTVFSIDIPIFGLVIPGPIAKYSESSVTMVTGAAAGPIVKYSESSVAAGCLNAAEE